MKLSRFICISILISFAAVSLFVVTEYIAYKLGFNTYLGMSIANFVVPFYNLAAIIGWIIKYYHKYSAVFDVAICICAGGLLSGFLVMGIASIILLHHSKFTDTHCP